MTYLCIILNILLQWLSTLVTFGPLNCVHGVSGYFKHYTVTFGPSNCMHGVSGDAELQIRGGIKDNSKIIFLISQRKHMLLPLIRTVSSRRF